MENQNKKSLLRVAVYIRVSTDQQAKKGDSVDEQKATCIEYVNEHENMILFGTYIDDGVSGQKLDRGEFTRLMNDVRAGNIDLIVFTKLDRWFRSLRHYLNTQEILQKCNVDWLAISQPYYDTTTPQGRAFVAQSMVFAELEAQNTSQRIMSVFDFKYKQGEVLSGEAPLGYSIVDKHLQPNEDAPKVMDAFQHYALSGSLSETIRYMISTYGLIRTQANMKGMLKNTKYIGIFRDNENYCPPIVPRDLFDDVQRKLTINIKTGQKHCYIFSGLTRCACCNHAFSGTIRHSAINTLTGRHVHHYPAYHCSYAFPRHLCDNRKPIYEKRLERYLLDNVKPLLEQYLIDYDIKNAPIADNRQKRAALYAKIDKLKELFINDLITIDEFKTDKAKYLDQIKALPDDSQPQKDLAALRSFLTLDLESIYDDMAPEEKRYLWRSIIKEIRVDNERNLQIIFL